MSKAGPIARYFFLDLVGSVIHFPLWWYTTGFVLVLNWARRSLVFHWRSYAIGLWIKNFFVPMYGQYDLWGRIVSVIIRLFVLLARFVAMVVLTFLYGLALMLWLISLPAIVFFSLRNVYGRFV